ncbi:universal stress protein [Pelotalea chapellei]|uniref:Universal stress protein n=1 Tax=Pelotalea chapellei TaxID=44671 RepID=A0ABS5UB82_9BACT|nr:universal stress protein [Pelotalea chapellei]MBT1072944.1 universal stress protein [Pelotalea chapellei]
MRILLAIDGSPSSDAAVAEVCRRPWPAESEVRIITVMTPLESMLFREKFHHPEVFDDVFKQQGGEAAKRLHDAAAHLEQRADIRVTPVLLEGLPKEVILDEAERWGADLIVLGSNGTGAIRYLFLGSVALAVAINAHCSVEIIRNKF